MITFLLTGFWDLITGFIRPKHPVDMNSQQIKGLPAPTQDDHAARKKYVDDSATGGGDMLKSDYDPNDDKVVVDSDKLEGSSKAQVRDHTPKAHTLASHSTKAHNELSDVTANQHHPQVHTHVEANITDLDHNAQKIKSKTVDAPVADDDGKVLAYDHANSKYKHIIPGGDIPNSDLWFLSLMEHGYSFPTSWTDLCHLKTINFLWTGLFPGYTDLEIWVVPIMEWSVSGTNAEVKLMYYDGGWVNMTTYSHLGYSFDFNYNVFGSWLRSDMSNPNEWKFQVRKTAGTLKKQDERLIVILKPTY